MGPLAVARWRAAVAVVVGLVAVGVAGCQGSTAPEIADANRTFPLPAEADLVLRLGPGTPRPDMRRLTVDLVERDGVLATEAHYDAGEVRVVVSRDMSIENRRRLRSDLLRSPEVVGVDLEPLKD